jgi:hypothetical protein
MTQTDRIFLGVVPRGALRYVAREIVRLDRPRFSVIEVAVKSGFPTAKVHASDIGLFSSLIGYLAADSMRVEDLGIRILDPGLERPCAEELAGLVATIRGIHCELADIWDIIERGRADHVSFFASVPYQRVKLRGLAGDISPRNRFQALEYRAAEWVAR